MQDISFTGTMFGYETKWKVFLFLPFLFVFRKTTAHLIEPDWIIFGKLLMVEYSFVGFFGTVDPKSVTQKR